MDQQEELYLAPVPRSVSAARRFVAPLCKQWLTNDQGDRFVLVASEIVTNAIRHARSLVRLRVIRRASTVRLEVDDAASTLPDMREIDPENPHGRGLHLVQAIADEWGVIVHPTEGKTVWAQVHVVPPAPRRSPEQLDDRDRAAS